MLPISSRTIPLSGSAKESHLSNPEGRGYSALVQAICAAANESSK
jgi:hypothetical protein